MQFKDMYWIFYDRVWKAADNAEFLYSWVRENYPEIKIAYILTKDNKEEWQRLSEAKFKLIDASDIDNTNNELKKCTHALSSIFAEGTNLSFEGCTCKRIFLNHGCFILPMVHLKEQADKIDLFIAGSHVEYTNMLNPFHQLNAQQVALCGLPRHDYLVQKQRQEHEENNILIQFWLRPKWNEKKLLASDFYQNVYKLLTDDRIEAIAKKHNVKFVFKLHSSNDPKNWEVKYNWLSYLPPATDWLRYSPSEELYEDLFVSSKLIVTDFSSNGSEMAKIDKPVLYFWPDPDYALPWRLRRNGGYEFDFINNGIGPVTDTVDDFFYELDQLLSQSCIPQQQYLDRRYKQISFINDDNCCERCFKAIIEIDRSRTAEYTESARRKARLAEAKKANYMIGNPAAQGQGWNIALDAEYEDTVARVSTISDSPAKSTKSKGVPPKLKSVTNPEPKPKLKNSPQGHADIEIPNIPDNCEESSVNAAPNSKAKIPQQTADTKNIKPHNASHNIASQRDIYYELSNEQVPTEISLNKSKKLLSSKPNKTLSLIANSIGIINLYNDTGSYETYIPAAVGLNANKKLSSTPVKRVATKAPVKVKETKTIVIPEIIKKEPNKELETNSCFVIYCDLVLTAKETINSIFIKLRGMFPDKQVILFTNNWNNFIPSGKPDRLLQIDLGDRLDAESLKQRAADFIKMYDYKFGILLDENTNITENIFNDKTIKIIDCSK